MNLRVFVPIALARALRLGQDIAAKWLQGRGNSRSG